MIWLKNSRIQKLRDMAVAPSMCYFEFYLNFYRYFEEKGEIYKISGYGDAFYYACSKITPVIDEGELIVGKPVSKMNDFDQKDWDEKYIHIARAAARFWTRQRILQTVRQIKGWMSGTSPLKKQSL